VELTEFHYITYKYITNEMLREFMMLGFEIQRLHRDMSLYFEDSKELSVQEHEKLHEYIVEGKKEESKALIESHLEKTERLLLGHIKELG
ncbi:FCD domain-containing protein, partial [Fusobacterium perfoetens]|uniref:FCD domain-containing protein n=1 Tax=Fusobacterium perfoetens TaxID=852 RepID=UPI001F3CF8E0